MLLSGVGPSGHGASGVGWGRPWQLMPGRQRQCGRQAAAPRRACVAVAFQHQQPAIRTCFPPQKLLPTSGTAHPAQCRNGKPPPAGCRPLGHARRGAPGWSCREVWQGGDNEEGQWPETNSPSGQPSCLRQLPAGRVNSHPAGCPPVHVLRGVPQLGAEAAGKRCLDRAGLRWIRRGAVGGGGGAGGAGGGSRLASGRRIACRCVQSHGASGRTSNGVATPLARQGSAEQALNRKHRRLGVGRACIVRATNA